MRAALVSEPGSVTFDMKKLFVNYLSVGGEYNYLPTYRCVNVAMTKGRAAMAIGEYDQPQVRQSCTART